MTKIFTFIVALFMVNVCYPQLTVKPTSPGKSTYLYVQDQILYVQGPIELQENIGNVAGEASIYLREEAQLIQGEAWFTGNTGDGVVSVFQEGTSNAYDYNYWSSPVGNKVPGNGLFGIEMLYAPQTELKSKPAIITSALNGSANPLTISSQWIFTYSGTSYNDWFHVGAKTIIPAGEGFTMKGVNGQDLTTINGRANNPGSGQRYDFRGKPNSGTISVFMSPGMNMLVGNPYPSALDLSLFLLENSGTGTLMTSCYGEITRKNAISGVAYFWDSKEDGTSHNLNQYVGGYGVFSPVDPCTAGIYVKPIFKKYGGTPQPPGLPNSNHYNRRFSPIAQGFIIKGVSNLSADFKNSQRVYRKEGNLSDFKHFKSTSEGDKEVVEIPRILFDVSINDQYVRQLSLAFWPSSTKSTDPAMDAPAYNVVPTDIGFLQNEQNYVIDIRPFDEAEEVPLFLKVEKQKATINIAVKEFLNFNTENIFLYDSMLQIYHPIKEKPLELELEPGVYHERYKITFRNKEEPVVVEEELVQKELHIFQNNGEGQLEITNPAILPVSEISIYDLSGRQVFYQKVASEKDFFQVATGSLRNSIYLVKVLNSDGSVKTQKISVRNTH